MLPKDAYAFAATWGSFMKDGDPGACMYCFDEDCRPQSEEHKQDVLDWMEKCRLSVVAFPENYDEDELEKIDRFVEFIKRRNIELDDPKPFIIELSTCGAVDCCTMDGDDISEESDLFQDLLDCCGPGDVSGACLHILEKYKPEFRIVRKTGGHYENVVASKEEKQAVCEVIYCCSNTDFSEEDTAEMYLIWEASCSIERKL